MSTVKIFIGNLSSDTESADVRHLFEKYGTVAECDVLKNYGFVHMNTQEEADTAIANLDGYNVKGQRMRVELSTGKRGNPKGDRRGDRGGDRGGRGGRSRPYPPGPPRRGGLPPPPAYDRFDPYYRYPYPERDPYYRLPPADRYLPPPDRYLPPLPRDRLLPEERGYPPLPDPRDRLLARERLPPYPEERAAFADRLRAAERAPLPADPYYRERSPPPAARPPPEYYDRKPALMRTPGAAEPAPSRLPSTAYPSSNGYDYYRRPAAAPERSEYPASAGNGQYYGGGQRGGAGGSAGYDRAGGQQMGGGAGAGGGGGSYGMQGQQSKAFDSQSALQTQPIYF